MKNTHKGFAVWIVVAIVAVLLAGGGTVYVKSRGNSVKTDAKVNNGVDTSAAVKADGKADAVATGKVSLRALIAKGQSISCTFNQTLDGVASSGTVYVANGKMRGDFVSKPSNTAAVNSHVIVDGQTMFAWSDGVSQGVKVTLDAQKQGQANGSGPDLEKEIDYKCSPWSADTAKFATPSTITFIDLSAMGR
jgi:hypothetical protein